MSIEEVVRFSRTVEFASKTGAKRVASSRALIALFTERTSHPIDDSIIRCTPMAAEIYAHFADPTAIQGLQARFSHEEDYETDVLLRPIVQRKMPAFLAMLLTTLAAYADQALSTRLLAAASSICVV